MNVNAAEIERIVRDVLNSLATGNGPAVAIPSPTRGTEGSLTDSVISVSSFRTLPATATSVRIMSRAVVTPSARDWCKERGLTLVRSEAASAPTAHAGAPVNVASFPSIAGPEPLYVAGSVTWMAALKKQLCLKQTRVTEPQLDDASVIRGIGSAIRQGHATCLAIVASPHSSLWQAARDEALRPAIVAHWSDLPDILREVPTNVLIVSSKHWNIAGVSNIARRFLDHTRAHS
jgi:hypothetical protein